MDHTLLPLSLYLSISHTYGCLSSCLKYLVPDQIVRTERGVFSFSDISLSLSLTLFLGLWVVLDDGDDGACDGFLVRQTTVTTQHICQLAHQHCLLPWVLEGQGTQRLYVVMGERIIIKRNDDRSNNMVWNVNIERLCTHTQTHTHTHACTHLYNHNLELI